MEPHPALSVVIAFVIAILTASFLFSVGYAFFDQPDYNDYCDLGPYPQRLNATQTEIDAYEQEQQECSQAYQDAQERVNNMLFYVVSILGVVVILGALMVHPKSVNLKFYLTSGVIFGSLAAILISTMRNWSHFGSAYRPLVLLIEIALVIFVAYRLFAGKKRKR